MELPARYLSLKDRDFDTLKDEDKLFFLNWKQHERDHGLRNDRAATLSAIATQVVNALAPVVASPADPANPPELTGDVDPMTLNPRTPKAPKRKVRKNLRPTVKV